MNHKGVALVEIVVSLLILAVAALAVTATVSLVNSKQMRSAGGSSLDLQALSYARETLESLKNNVSTDAGRAALLSGSAAGVVHDSASDAGNPLTVVPASDLLNHGGTRSYKVWDVDANSDGTTDYKKVTVTVQWTD